MITERQQERIDIIKQLIGHINGIGETNYDNKSLENLDFLRLLLDNLRDVLVENANYEGYEASRLDIKRETLKIYQDFEDDIMYLKGM